jgi:hypothetical protein
VDGIAAACLEGLSSRTLLLGQLCIGNRWQPFGAHDHIPSIGQRIGPSIPAFFLVALALWRGKCHHFQHTSQDVHIVTIV